MRLDKPTYRLSDSPSDESPEIADTGTKQVKTPYGALVIGILFLVGSWAFFSFMSTEGCVREGISFVCDDGSSFSLVWPVAAALLGLIAIAFAVAGFRSMSNARAHNRMQSGQQWPPAP